METVINPRELRVNRGDTLAFRALELVDGFTVPSAMTFSVLDENGNSTLLGSMANGRIYPTNLATEPGAYNCKIPGSVTAALEVKVYQYRLRMTYSEGTFTVAAGNLKVED